MSSDRVELHIPRSVPSQLRTFRRYVLALGADETSLAKSVPDSLSGVTRAAALVLRDLRLQGWSLQLGGSVVTATSKAHSIDPSAEKERIRFQERLKRAEQLRQPSVERFVRGMERPLVRGTRPVSISTLVRDGRELAERLETHRSRSGDAADFASVMQPVIEVVEPGKRCNVTGLKLTDIWRYFRYTWSSQYNSIPGRSMQVLVRDAALPDRPVMGLIALSSAIVQLEQRDAWIGWDAESVLRRLDQTPTTRSARWLRDRLASGLAEIYVRDLIADGIVTRQEIRKPSALTIESLREEAASARADHYRYSRQSDLKWSSSDASWESRARTDLFRSRRAGLLSDLLEIQMALRPILVDAPSPASLKEVLATKSSRRAIQRLIRRTKSERVGTLIADLTCCGALDPYRPLVTGKLIAMLAVGPEVVGAFIKKYHDAESEIASSIAGRSIIRDSRIAFIGTTSLYGSQSSQYNRIKLPSEVAGGDIGSYLEYRKLGRSKSYGSSHFAEDTVAELSRLASRSNSGIRVNSVFGEGVSPKMRKIKLGLEALGWSQRDLLQHGRARSLYGVNLVDNLSSYLLGMDKNPRYLCPPGARNSTEAISKWWYKRWASNRIQNPGVISAIRTNGGKLDGRHGALVDLPLDNYEDL